MIGKIQDILNGLGIDTYCIRETRSWSAEGFFVKKNLDLKRRTTLTDYQVSVYCISEKDGERFTGDSTVPVYPGMDDEELKRTLKSAYHAASFVRNPYYPLPEGKKETPVSSESGFAGMPLEKCMMRVAEILYASDVCEDVFVNSAEIFAVKKIRRVVNSRGVDVSWETFEVNGEYVIQCITPNDVETHHRFAMREPDEAAFRADVEHALRQTRDRAQATQPAPGGTYTVILSGENVNTLVSYYVDRASAGMIYQRYSDYEVGKAVQGESVRGDALTIRLKAAEPYDSQGIALTDRTLLENGVVRTIQGGARMAHYLGIEPTGEYRWIEVPTGSAAFSEMKKRPCLHVVLFSDFQMDSMTGCFGGEIRLAYLYDGTDIKRITGGSLNGSILKAQENMTFSRERYRSAAYEGPFAVAIPDVTVAGISAS